MSRNKENNPLPSQTRVNGSIFGASRPAPSSDFFTDSLLDDTSRIPSPSPQKHGVGKPRRAVPPARALQVSQNSANTAHRSSSPQTGKPSTRHLQLAPALRKPSSRSSQQDLITPPQSRDGLDLKSPTSDVSSPPRGLTDVYQRIYDEEELAATERSSESEEEVVLRQDEESPRRPRQSSSQRSLASKGSTPVAMSAHDVKESANDEQTGSLSEASGLSFLQGLTNENLAAVMTPHFTNRAKDRKRLQNISTRPILFSQGPRPCEIAEDGSSVTSSDRGSNSGMREGQEPVGGTMAYGVSRLSSDKVIESRIPSNRIDAPRRATPPKINKQDNSEDEHTSDELKAMEKELQNRKLKRLLSGTKSTSAGVGSKSSQSTADKTPREVLHSVNHQQSPPPSNAIPTKNPVPATTKGMLSMWARKASEQRDQRQSDSSQVDWARAGADVPLPSVEDSSTPQATPTKPDAPGSVRSQKSIDKLRRLDNDFTGMSFQVSESPPVRSKRSVEDYLRDKEMDSLHKKALTTNRLDAIREKDPREAHRKLSRSPSAGQLKDRPSLESLSTSQERPQSVGERVPDTPVMIYRSSTNSSKDGDRHSQGSSDHRRSSLDQLQRLARAMSTTPRSSPAPPPMEEDEDNEHDLALDDEPIQKLYASSANAPELQHQYQPRPAVLATPKVTGGWIDTILPDTLKTTRQTAKQPPRYAQTPHVSAGGWVDTPMVNGHRQSSALAPMTIEEVTEVLPSDEPRSEQPKVENTLTSEHQPLQPVEVGTTSPPPANQRQLPPSILRHVLEDDTFDFGETTIDSLGNLADTTAIIASLVDDRRAALTQAQGIGMATDELGFIDHLGGKLREVAVGLHDTRKGISNLERAFMRASSPAVADASTPQRFDNNIIPIVYSTITLPIPLLFNPVQWRTKDQRHSSWIPFGRPTLLGYITLATWVWYLCECFASELFSHPLHAERYVWPPSHSPEPAFPFVIPTLLLRAFGMNINFGTAGGLFWTTFGTIYVVSRAIYRIVGMWVGWTDGFVDDLGTSAAMRNATAAVIQAAKTAATTGLNNDWSIMNDEII